MVFFFFAVVVGVLDVGVALELVVVLVAVLDEEELLPHAANASVLASTARAVSMALSGVLLIGRAPFVARGLGRSPYQALAA